MGRFFLFLFLSAVVIAGVTLFGFSKPSFFTQTLIFLLFSTGVLFVYLFRVDKPDFFLQLYLLSMTVKLLAYCAYCLLMILKDPSGALANVVFFLVCYIVFTALEIGFLYRKINGGSTPSGKG